MKRLVSFALAVLLAMLMLTGPGMAEAIAAEQLYYSLKNGQITIACIDGDAPNCILPDQIDGYKVVGIDENALDGSEAIRSLWIPESISELPEQLLAGRDELTLVVQEGSPAEQWAQEHGAKYVPAQAVEKMLGKWYLVSESEEGEVDLRENGDAQIVLDGDTQICPWYVTEEGFYVMMGGAETLLIPDDGILMMKTGKEQLVFSKNPSGANALTIGGFFSGIGEYLMSLLNGEAGYSLTWTVDLEQEKYQDSYTYALGAGKDEAGRTKVVFAEGEEPVGLMTFLMDDKEYKMILPDDTIKGSYDQIMEYGADELDVIALIAQAFKGDSAEKTIQLLDMLWQELQDDPKIIGMTQAIEQGGEAEINLAEAQTLLSKAIKGLSVNTEAVELMASHSLIDLLGIPTENRSMTIMGFMRLIAESDIDWNGDVYSEIGEYVVKRLINDLKSAARSYLRIAKEEGKLRLEWFRYGGPKKAALTISEQAGGLRIDFWSENYQGELLSTVLTIEPAADGWDIQGSLSVNKGAAWDGRDSFGIDSMSLDGKIYASTAYEQRAELHLTAQYGDDIGKLHISADQALNPAAEEIKAFRAVMEEKNDLPVATFVLTTGDVIRMELYPEIAPNTVANFIELIEQGYYDGTIFHRVIPGFIIQGGSPNGDGTGSIGYTIPGEFASNGFENNLQHVRGVVSMARAQNPDSADCQFFIVLGSAVHLNGEYAAFGRVFDEDMAIVEQIAQTKTDSYDKPLTDWMIAAAIVEVPEESEEHIAPVVRITPEPTATPTPEPTATPTPRPTATPTPKPTATPTPTPRTVNMIDDALAACIRKEVGKPSGNLTTADLEKVTRISVIGEKVLDTSVLSYCTNLQALALIDCGLTEMPDLSGLKHLSRLELNQNEIRTIESGDLDGLDSLTYIALYQNPLVDVSGLSDLREDAFIDMLDESKNENPYVNDVVRQIQTLLIEKNYLVDISDGSFGPKAEAAVRELQADAGLQQTGKFDQQTLRALSRMPDKKFETTQKRQIVIYNAYRGEDGMVYFKVKNTGSEALSGIQIAGRQLNYSRENVGSLNGTNGGNYYTYYSWSWDDGNLLEPGEANWCRITNMKDVRLRDGAYYANLWRYSLTTADDIKIQLFDNSQEPTSTIVFKFVK